MIVPSVEKQIKIYLRKQGINIRNIEVYLIGSAAKDLSKLNENSDIDILITPRVEHNTIREGNIIQNVIQIDKNKYDLHVNFGKINKSKPNERII